MLRMLIVGYCYGIRPGFLKIMRSYSRDVTSRDLTGLFWTKRCEKMSLDY
jgi:hypothetical protein